MTILTKPSNEKKPEKILPLGVVNEDGTLLNPIPSAPSVIPFYHNGDSESMAYDRSRLSTIKIALLFLGSLLVMLMGILGGYTMYRLYAPLHGNLHFHGMCDIPYYPKNGTAVAHLHGRPDIFQLSELRNLFPQLSNNSLLFDDDDDDFFHEEIELDLAEEDQYAKIDVPDFKDGRRGRFMHDFKENQSAIIDTSANRCFIMPLDRETTLPPKSFLDLLQKTRSGYYNIDTNRVRRYMRVVTPELTDLSLISKRIGNECYDMRVYLLEKYESGVFKREAVELSEEGKFAAFHGKGIVLYNIQNINDIKNYEQLHKK